VIRAKLYFNHWSLHLIDRQRGWPPQVNLLGVEARWDFPHESVAHLFIRGQWNLHDSQINYNRPVVIGCRLILPAPQYAIEVYTEQAAEIGALTFYRGEAGIKFGSRAGLEIFYTWSNGRQRFSSLHGETPIMSELPEAGLRFHY
jgi:hypothetical protein